MPGRTAYFGMLDVAVPRPDDTVVVSGAAGAVGSVAGQIASLAGAKVVGTAGSGEKVSWLVDGLGFDSAINYKTQDVEDTIASACPEGVDVYFDNVGGPITDAVLRQSNANARAAICGQIAHYNDAEEATGPRILPMLKYATIEDFTVAHYAHRYEEATDRLRKWVSDGTVSYRETVTEGLANAPEAFIGLFDGENIGKQLVKVS